MAVFSVIIGTYNHLCYLKLCLASLQRQTYKDFEVIVADDGSGVDVKKWLESQNTPFSLTHLWHEDKGFRKCKMLNRAVQQSTTDYIVFIDADCILSRNFLYEHWRNHEKGVFLGGRRALVVKELAETVTFEMIQKGCFDGVTLWGISQVIKGKIKYYEEVLRPLYYFRKNSFLNLMGCNFSIYKSDLNLVNGFDEEYETSGGGEDTDISLRLKVAGCRMKSVRYCAIQFHLGYDIPEDKSKSAKMFSEKKKLIKTTADAKSVKSSLRDIH